MMTLVARLARWLVVPPISGMPAIAWSIAAIAVPTIVRASVDGMVHGVAFVIYSPFVLLSAVMLGWGHAAVVAIAGALIADALFVGTPFELVEGPADIFGVTVFLASSFLIIGLVQAMRTVMEHHGRPPGATDGIIFSEERGQAWASWPGASYYVRLGPKHQVAEMMEDYLAQLALAERLNGAGYDKRKQLEGPAPCTLAESNSLKG